MYTRTQVHSRDFSTQVSKNIIEPIFYRMVLWACGMFVSSKTLFQTLRAFQVGKCVFV